MKHVSVIAMVASDQTSQHVGRVHLYGDAGVVAAATMGADLVLTREAVRRQPAATLDRNPAPPSNELPEGHNE